GTGEPGSKVIITDKDGNTVTTTVDPSGNWHIGPENPLEEGEKGTIEAKDPAGNTSGKDPIVGGDQTPPSKPIVTENNGDGIGGTGEPGSKVIITDKDGNTVTTTVDPSGNWHIGPENPLEEGEKGTIEAKDPAGNTSGKDQIVGGDQTPPQIPVVTENNANGLGGTGEPGSKVTITDKDGNTVTTTVDPSGHWHVGPNPLEEGEKGTIEAKDAAGNSSEKGPVIGGDQTAPNTPEINPINLVDPITGTAEPNSEVVVKFPNGTTTTVQADDKGNWSVPNPGLKDGDEVTATATDKAGNTSVPGTEIVDGIPPKAPVVNPVNGHDPITGTSEPGATIHVKFPDGTTVTTTVDASGKWSVPNPGLADKSQIIVNATDPAGNKSPDVLATVDAFAAAPTIALANDTGTSKTDGITSDGTVKVSGLETRAKWEYSLDGGKTWKTGAGTTFVIPEGKYDAGKILVKQTDIAGNTSTNASLGPVTIDKTVPNVPVINTTGEHTPIVGSAEAGSIVKVTYPDGKGGTTTVTTTADASGNWTVPNPGLKDGDTVTATATDEAGNVSQPGQTTIDGTAPATPAAPTEYLDNTDPQQGTFGTGTSTNDTTPGLIIPAPAAGETPKLYVDG
ncbi:Ig-like domain-containing protein, partial [Acinetobacter gerneri]